MIRLVLSLAVFLAFVAPALAEDVLTVGDQKGGSRAVMEAAGVLNDAPYRIEWKEFPAAAPLLEALNAGAIETGIVGDAPFTFAVAAGVKAKAIASIRQNPEGLAVLVQAGSPVRGFADLKGKTIGTGKGSIGHQLVLAAIEHEGFKPGDVTVRFLSPVDAKTAYASGQIDAWSTWEPYVSQEEVLSGARRVATGAGLTAGLSFQVARDDAIAAKRPLLEDFLTRLARARKWSLGHVDSYAESWGKLVGVDPKVSKHWLNRARISLAPIDDGVAADQQKAIELYARNGLIKASFDARDSLDPSFAASIAAGLRPVRKDEVEALATGHRH
ncbi:ABC transporter substrate-binding protein [Methylopila sp. M107]|uniref:ABC transporter substrate-binding protein n=1 Tax=Methylopila sp. M107 TaxID=1101190 RepID=UPI000366646E|nr:ABC transporter substrate-binding protein [Methylopila sp. M107]